MADLIDKAECYVRADNLENLAQEADFVSAASPTCPAPGALPLPIREKTLKLAIAALGVVYGDIGQAPSMPCGNASTGRMPSP